MATGFKPYSQDVIRIGGIQMGQLLSSAIYAILFRSSFSPPPLLSPMRSNVSRDWVAIRFDVCICLEWKPNFTLKALTGAAVEPSFHPAPNTSTQ
jgi:hypothetical protein